MAYAMLQGMTTRNVSIVLSSANPAVHAHAVGQLATLTDNNAPRISVNLRPWQPSKAVL
jgi:hypothetical protein